ncbi:MAG: hypothetical protein HZB38_05325 [Planctomycetes bacterium]|nr:hypothetical protein [Planctomycetota bacterium]
MFRPVDSSIRCLHCDYSLRGLDGDPIRCPECGQITMRAEADVRRRRLRIAHDKALFSAAFLTLGLVVAAVAIFNPPAFACACVLAIPWLITTTNVARMLRFRRGWAAAYAKHQLLLVAAAFAVLALIFGLIPLLLILTVALSTRLPQNAVGAILGLLAGVAVCIPLAALLLRVADRCDRAAMRSFDRFLRGEP